MARLPSAHRGTLQMNDCPTNPALQSIVSCRVRWPRAVSVPWHLKRLHHAIFALLVCSTASAEAPKIEPLQAGLNGAGCVYAINEDGPAIFVVEARSKPDNIKSIARIRIDGVEYDLDRANADADDDQTWSRGAMLVSIEKIIEGASLCSSLECEGTRFTAQLTVSGRGAPLSVAVHGHCGA